MYIKKEHVELVDEMFEFPKGKNDDLLDGLWYSITTAKPPKSSAIDIDKFSDIGNKSEEIGVKRAISWITGQKT